MDYPDLRSFRFRVFVWQSLAILLRR